MRVLAMVMAMVALWATAACKVSGTVQCQERRAL